MIPFPSSIPPIHTYVIRKKAKNMKNLYLDDFKNMKNLYLTSFSYPFSI